MSTFSWQTLLLSNSAQYFCLKMFSYTIRHNFLISHKDFWYIASFKFTIPSKYSTSFSWNDIRQLYAKYFCIFSQFIFHVIYLIYPYTLKKTLNSNYLTAKLKVWTTYLFTYILFSPDMLDSCIFDQMFINLHIYTLILNLRRCTGISRRRYIKHPALFHRTSREEISFLGGGMKKAW